MKLKKVIEDKLKQLEEVKEPINEIKLLEFHEGLHVSREEFNHVVAKLNEVIKKVN